MVSSLVVGLDLGSDLQSRAFVFWVVLGFEGLGSEGGCFFGFLAGSEGLGSHEGEVFFFFLLQVVWVGQVEVGLAPPMFVEMQLQTQDQQVDPKYLSFDLPQTVVLPQVLS